jgi:hypothetical protein
MPRPVKYPFANLEVGQHLDVPLSEEKAPDGSNRAARCLRWAAKRHANLYGGEFQVRTLRKEGVARCIRVV